MQPDQVIHLNGLPVDFSIVQLLLSPYLEGRFQVGGILGVGGLCRSVRSP